MYRCSVCKGTNCIKIDNLDRSIKNAPYPRFKCKCFKCNMITDLEYFNDTKIRPTRESNPFNNLPENFTND